MVSAPAGRISLDAVRDMLATTKSDGRVFPSSDLLGAADPVIKYAVNVTNTGSVDSDEVVLGFMKPPGAGTGGVPLQTLYGFDRVHVPAGKTVTVELYPSVSAAPHFAVLSAEVSRRCCCCSLPSSPRSTRRASATRCRASTVRSSPSSPAAPPPVSTLISALRSLPLWRRRRARRQTRHGLRGAQDHDGLRASHHRWSRNGKRPCSCFARPFVQRFKIRRRRRQRAQRRRQPPCARGAGRRSPSRQALHPAPPRRRPAAAPAPAGRGRRRPARRAAG